MIVHGSYELQPCTLKVPKFRSGILAVFVHFGDAVARNVQPADADVAGVMIVAVNKEGMPERSLPLCRISNAIK